MAEKGEKVEKGEKIEKSEKMEKGEKKEKGRGLTFLQVISLILIIIIIALLLIVVQVPYTTTNAVKETVQIQNCSQGNLPFLASFRSGVKYDSAPRFSSTDGVALRKYSDLKTNIYVTIRDMSEEKGTYCVKAETYYIKDFADEQDKLSAFQTLLSDDSDRIEKLENDIPNSKACTENPILPKRTGIVSFWSSSFMTDDINNKYDLNDIYVLLTVVAPPSKDCVLQDVEKTTEQEVTRYCNAWKHVVGKC